LGKGFDPLSPSSVAAWAKEKLHVFFDLVVVEAIGLSNEVEADMVTESHLDELTFVCLREFTVIFHKVGLMKLAVKSKSCLPTEI